MKFVHACIVSVIMLCASYLFFSVSNNLDATGVSSLHSSMPYPIAANPPCVVDDDCNSGLLCNAGFCENIFACSPLMDARWDDPEDLTAGGAFDYATNTEYLDLVPIGTDRFALRAFGELGEHRFERTVVKEFDEPIRAWGGRAEVNLHDVIDNSSQNALAFIGAYSDDTLKRNFAIYSMTSTLLDQVKILSFNVFHYSNLAINFNSELPLENSPTTWPDRFVPIEWYITPQFKGYARVDNQKWVEIPTDMISHLDSFTTFRTGWVSSYNGGYIDISHIILYDGRCLSDPTGGNSADIEIASSNLPPQLNIGQQYPLSFNVMNNGTPTGDAMIFRYDYPDNLLKVLPMEADCTDSKGQYVCIFQDTGTPYTVEMRVEPRLPGELSGGAVIAPYANDPLLSNNAGYVLVPVFVPTDLAIDVLDTNRNYYTTGEPVNLVIDYRNIGPHTIANSELIEIQINYESNFLDVDEVIAPGAECGIGNGEIICEVNRLNPFLEILHLITIRGTFVQSGDFHIGAEIDMRYLDDPVPANNNDNFVITVSDVGIKKPRTSRIIEKTPEPVEEESTEKESEEEEPTEPTTTEPEPEANKTSPRFVRVE